MTRTSYKQCDELAEANGWMFYGKDEHKLNNKCYVKVDGEFLEFNTYTEAYMWMADKMFEGLGF